MEAEVFEAGVLVEAKEVMEAEVAVETKVVVNTEELQWCISSRSGCGYWCLIFANWSDCWCCSGGGGGRRCPGFSVRNLELIQVCGRG